MTTNLAYLRVKIKSLAAEQRIIRHEERRHRGQRRWHLKRQDADAQAEALYGTMQGLRGHRMELRLELRSALLAYGYLRKRRYAQLEGKLCPHKPGPNWKRAAEIVVKFGPPTPKATYGDIQKALETWSKAA